MKSNQQLPLKEKKNADSLCSEVDLYYKRRTGNIRDAAKFVGAPHSRGAQFENGCLLVAR